MTSANSLVSRWLRKSCPQNVRIQGHARHRGQGGNAIDARCVVMPPSSVLSTSFQGRQGPHREVGVRPRDTFQGRCARALVLRESALRACALLWPRFSGVQGAFRVVCQIADAEKQGTTFVIPCLTISGRCLWPSSLPESVPDRRHV